MKSEGTFVHGRPHHSTKKAPTDTDESSDAYDTVEWLVFRFFGMFPKMNPKMYFSKDSRDPDYGTPDGYK
jgi:hypothetical protein